MLEQRDRWFSRASFVTAAIGSAVGLGNVWRFPFVAYKYGGGAFLIPYFVALITAGIPLMILEYGLGQMMQCGAPEALRKVKKRWEWVGWWALGVGSVISFYYAVVMAWCWNYLYYSFTVAWKDDAGGFFNEQVLQKSAGPGELGGLVWPVVFALALTWLIIYFCIFKGVRIVGKVVMVTVPLPVILLGVLLVRGVTLPGAFEGLGFYLTPDFSALMDHEVWLAAYGQIFFSLSLGFGIMIAYASYEAQTADVTNNAFITSLANCGTSYFAGFAVFSTLGYLAYMLNQPVSEVIEKGPTLAFVTYPLAISLLPKAVQIFGVIFFITLLTLGIDSAFSIVEAVVTGIRDKWEVPRKKIVFGFCVVAFLAGLLFCTRAGLYWLDIMDEWMTRFGLACVGLLECVIIGWFFKTRRLKDYINSVSEIRIGLWWDIFIKVLTPAILGTSIVLSVIERIQKPYMMTKEIPYPPWSLWVGGWLVAGAVVAVGIILMRIKGKEIE
ncbi:MAG: transporter [Planctomycetes bacterium DG_23]|nr:MAG: transporter [Planctomycetes bacterium DG_23]